MTKNSEVLESEKCDRICAGRTSGKFCGGDINMSAFEIEHEHIEIIAATSGNVGCYKDASSSRAMNEEAKYVTGDMPNEVSVWEEYQYLKATPRFDSTCAIG